MNSVLFAQTKDLIIKAPIDNYLDSYKEAAPIYSQKSAYILFKKLLMIQKEKDLDADVNFFIPEFITTESLRASRKLF